MTSGGHGQEEPGSLEEPLAERELLFLFGRLGGGAAGLDLGPLEELDLVEEGGRHGFPVFPGLGLLVGLDDLLDEGMADDVPVVEVDEGDLLERGEDLHGVEDAGLAGLGQVDLGDVGRDDQLRVEAGPGQDHLHLLPGRVLGLVEDDEGAVQGPAAHEGQGGDLDDAALDQAVGLVVLEEVEEGVVERAEVGVDLLDEVAGQEAELLAGLDGRAGQDDAVDGLVLEEGQGHGHGQVGLARPGRADAEDEVVGLDRLEIGLLVEALGGDGLAGQVQGLGGA